MIVAFISDIHGNYSALSAVFREIKRLNIKKIYCLGDIVNYYYDPDKCINLLRKYKISEPVTKRKYSQRSFEETNSL